MVYTHDVGEFKRIHHLQAEYEALEYELTLKAEIISNQADRIAELECELDKARATTRAITWLNSGRSS